MKNSSKLLTAVSAFAFMAISANPALAEGTDAGSTITNTVQVDFQVGGVAQTATAATDDFTVDRKVNLTVTEVGGVTTSVSPGQTDAVTTFELTNLSNDTIDFDLTASQLAGGAAPNGGTDNFDATNVRIFLDDGDGVFDAGDTLVTYIDELAADDSVTLFVVSEIPAGQSTGDIAAVSLEADSHAGGNAGSLGAELVDTVGANTAGVDTVLADLSGSDDADNDGAFSARDDYTVAAAALSATKVSTIISDPVNGTTNPKAIPGAVIEYCIAVSNAAGSATATNVTISDPLPAETTFVAGSILLDGTVDGTGACNADGTAGGSFGAGQVNGTLSDLDGGDQSTLVFRATID